MRADDILTENGNVSVNGVLDIISKESSTGYCTSAGYCHGQVARAIKNDEVNDDDLLILLGNGTDVYHSIIADRQGNPKVDSFASGFKGINPSKGTYRYLHPSKTDSMEYKPTKVMSVGKFKSKYMDNAPT